MNLLSAITKRISSKLFSLPLLLSCSILLNICHCANALELSNNGIYAIKIVDLNTSKVVYEKNPDTLLIPASNQKLFTAYSALKILGPNHYFKTKLLADAPVKNGVINGNVYIKFGGDPDFTSSKLQLFFDKLKELKVKKISGDIVIDDSRFDQEYFGHGWSIDQVKFCFSAPISAITIDGNCFKTKLSRGTGNKINITPVKSAVYKSFVNSASITSDASDCELELAANSNNEYSLYGCHKKGDAMPILNIAVQNPRLLAQKVLSAMARKNQISYKSIKFSKAKPAAKELKAISSPKVSQLIKSSLQDSDNLVSEALLKEMARVKTGWAGNWKNGIGAMQEQLSKDLGIDEKELYFKDGSGASRKNLVSPSQITKLLQKIYNDPAIFSLYRNSLALSGKSGTLSNRFLNTPLEGKIYGKTGTIDNVSTLSGYSLSKDKHYAFSIMINNSTLKKKELKEIQESILLHFLD